MCIPRMTRLDSEIISSAKQMKLIVQFGVGLEGISLDLALFMLLINSSYFLCLSD